MSAGDAPFRLVAGGDMALGHEYDRIAESEGPDFPMCSLRPYLAGADLVLGNLEGPLCLSGEPYAEKCSIRGHPGYAKALADAGFHVLGLANNHILDYREAGLEETWTVLRGTGLQCFGAGRDLDEATRELVWESRGIRVAVFGACDVHIDSPFYARDGERGIAPLDVNALADRIRSRRGDVHARIVVLHWGEEHRFYPLPEQRLTARRLVDAGADLILGHHPHVVQGSERIGDSYVFYSLGNLLFSDLTWLWTPPDRPPEWVKTGLTRSNKRSLLVVAEIDETGIRRVEAVPFRIDGRRRAVPDLRAARFREIRTRSEPFARPDYPAFFERYLARAAKIDRVKAQVARFQPSHVARWVRRLTGRLACR